MENKEIKRVILTIIESIMGRNTTALRLYHLKLSELYLASYWKIKKLDVGGYILLILMKRARRYSLSCTSTTVEGDMKPMHSFLFPVRARGGSSDDKRN